MKGIVQNYRSRRNHVCLLNSENGSLIQKTYQDPESSLKELRVYEMLKNSNLPHANLLDSGANWIQISLLPGNNLLEILEEQEAAGKTFWEPWEKLVTWLIQFRETTGLVMTDVNLRNFIYDERSSVLYGVDFEECQEGGMLFTASRLAAYILTYAPEHTPIKHQIVEFMLRKFSEDHMLTMEELFLETERQEVFLRMRRENKKK